MSGKFEGIKVGDKVVVTIEGKVTYSNSGGTNIEIGDLDLYDYDERIVAVEKVAPPITTFTAGQRVKNRNLGFEYTIATNGYFDHELTRAVISPTTVFQSDTYELVSA